MNIHPPPPPPINALATALRSVLNQRNSPSLRVAQGVRYPWYPRSYKQDLRRTTTSCNFSLLKTLHNSIVHNTSINIYSTTVCSQAQIMSITIREVRFNSRLLKQRIDNRTCPECWTPHYFAFCNRSGYKVAMHHVTWYN